MPTDMSVSTEILRQLGGYRFNAMTGASNFVGDTNSLTFKIGKNAKKVTHVRITLSPTDLYDVEFLRIRKLEIELISKANGVFFDQLQKIFTEHTGMDTSLQT